ncbi:hypothetical protein N657DRAFT_406941 [Parathielavia appendiculata]|uniref:Uncharacterized protein n=1 Tax=Parathielavia appendiculata TaxID=2587402 RepID=A0AAN6YXV7_9PEZI|nr:hypothetical protein N657DRAFT_406941 [Parathielavia appendiculata]
MTAKRRQTSGGTRGKKRARQGSQTILVLNAPIHDGRALQNRLVRLFTLTNDRVPDPAFSNANARPVKSAPTILLEPINTNPQGHDGLVSSNHSTKRRKTRQHAAGELCHSNSERAEQTSAMHIRSITASREERETRSTGRGNHEQQHHSSQLPGVNQADVFVRPALSPHGHAMPVEPETGAGSGQAHLYPSPIEASRRPTFQSINEPTTGALCHRHQEASLHLLADAAVRGQVEPRPAVPSRGQHDVAVVTTPWDLPRDESNVRGLSSRDVETAELPLPEPLSDGSFLSISFLNGQGAGQEAPSGIVMSYGRHDVMALKTPRQLHMVSGAAGEAAGPDEVAERYSPHRSESLDHFMKQVLDLPEE